MTNKNTMRNKDYFRLAKQSLKSRKKSTRTTVAGIAFGLILILPVLYFTFAFFIDFNSKINKIPTVAMFDISTTADPSKDFASSDNYNGYLIRGSETVDELLKTAKYQDIIHYNQYKFSQSEYLQIKINNGAFSPLQEQRQGETIKYPDRRVNYGLNAIDYDLSNGKVINDSTAKYLKKVGNKPFLTSGNTFTADSKGKGELLIANSYAMDNDINVGDTISMAYNGRISSAEYNYRIDNDSNPDNFYDYSVNGQGTDSNYKLTFMKEFKVVGLISDDYYKLSNTEQDPIFFMTTASYINANGSKNAPNATMKTYNSVSNGASRTENYTLITYTEDYNTLCTKAADNGQMALLHGITNILGNNSYGGLASISKEHVARVQFDNYAEADQAHKFLKAKIKAVSKELQDTSYANNLFGIYQTMNMIGTIVVSVFMVFGGVILFATMINLYNSIQYSVESRRNYMGMLRAVGAKNNILHRMYFTEVILIFLKSLPWIVIFGGGICIGVKFAVDSLFAYIGNSLGMILSLSLWYIPVVFAIIFAFAFGIGLIYSRISCKPITTKGILSLLKEDR